MPRDITSVIEQLTPQQIARLAQRLGIARPGGFLQPPIAQGAGLATALLAGLVETQYTETMPVVLNARSFTRYSYPTDQVVALSTTLYSPAATPAVLAGEFWLFIAMAQIVGAVGDTAGIQMGFAVGAATSFSWNFSLAPAAAGLSAGQMAPPQAFGARATQAPFDKSGGTDVLAFGAASYSAGGSQSLAIQNMSAANPITVKAGSGFVAIRVG